MKFLRVTMPDGSRWDVPARLIAEDRGRHYSEDPAITLADDYTLRDWAAGNMDWADVVEFARKVADPPSLDARGFQEGWVNGAKEVVEVEGKRLTAEQIECCRRIGRDEASRSSVIGLAELDALCDTALALEGMDKHCADVELERAILALPPAFGPCPDDHVDVRLMVRLPDALARKLKMGVHSGIREMANPPGKFLGMVEDVVEDVLTCEPLRPEDFERAIEASREVDAGKLADAQAERLALLSEALAEGDIAVRADYEGFLREMKAANMIGDYKMTGSDTALVRLKQPLRHVKVGR